MINSHILSNTAMDDGGGIYIDVYDAATAILTGTYVAGNVSLSSGGGIKVDRAWVTLYNSHVLSNTAEESGGGISGSVVITDSYILSNTAGFSGGGISGGGRITGSYIVANSAPRGGGLSGFSATITASYILSNTAIEKGGGLDLIFATITGTHILSNSAAIGAGLYLMAAGDTGSTLDIADSEIASNRAEVAGGGLYIEPYVESNPDTATVTITNTEIVSNSAANGGGIYNIGSLIALTNSKLAANRAEESGGGAYTVSLLDPCFRCPSKVPGVIEVVNSAVISNSAANGGGIFVNAGEIEVANAKIAANRAEVAGGALYVQNIDRFRGIAHVTNSEVVSNSAANGGAFQFTGGELIIGQSCIIGNSDTAVNQVGAIQIDARDNWWGVSSGPSGAGAGAGDSVSANVLYSPHLTSAILECPTLAAAMVLTKASTPAGVLVPGQPLTYTLTISNGGTTELQNIYVHDSLPSGFQLSQVNSTGATFEPEGSDYRIVSLSTGQVATLQLGGQVDLSLTADQLLENTATITHSVANTRSASASNNVVFPKVKWSAASYEAGEAGEIFTATVMISPVTAYATVTVEATIVDGMEITRVLTFPPGSSSQPVAVMVNDHVQAGPRTIQLELSAPVNAALGDPSMSSINVSEVIPVLNWSSATYDVDEGSGSFKAYVILSPVNPDATVTVEATIEDSAAAGTMATQLLTFPPGSSSQPVVVNIVDDEEVTPRTIALGLQSPSGARLGSRSHATIILIENDVERGLEVTVRADKVHAKVGESILYTYRITNTGVNALTISNAVDDHAGVVAGLIGGLAPHETRSATMSYVVKESDKPGPLVNEVVVTASDDEDISIVRCATTTVALGEFIINLPQISR